MSQEAKAFEDLASMNAMGETILNTISSLVKSMVDAGQSLHGEASVAAAIKNGQAANITRFDCGNKDLNIAENQKELYRQFKVELQKQGITYIDVSIGEDGTKGIIFQDKDIEKVREITEKLNIQKERTKNWTTFRQGRKER